MTYELKKQINTRPAQNIHTSAEMAENRRQPDATASCRFCMPKIAQCIVDAHNTVIAIEDRFPVSQGHHLIIPKRHTTDWFSMTEQEKRDADMLISRVKQRLQEADKSITGFNIGMNCGASAGQTIFHAHIHLIPRRDNDTPDPTGGVRGVIPDKMCYRIED